VTAPESPEPYALTPDELARVLALQIDASDRGDVPTAMLADRALRSLRAAVAEARRILDAADAGAVEAAAARDLAVLVDARDAKREK
jgi:hypothetical protein